MIDHIGLSVSDIELAKRFYSAALAPLNMSLLMEFPASVTGSVDVAGFGEAGKPEFWVHSGGEGAQHVHLAFRASSRAVVDAFWHAAIAAGGSDNGAPGLRPQYHPHYYGAFIIDPDGHNIEAVCHDAA